MNFSGLKPHAEGSVLGRIVARKIEDLRVRSAGVDRGGWGPSERSFFDALAGGRALIAEVKKRSPSKGVLRENLDLETVAAAYERRASAISVVTDGPFFGGSLELLREVRARVSRPVMLKDFVVSEFQVREARAFGADAVLLMSSVLERDRLASLYALTRSLGMEAVVEVHDQRELEEVLSTEARIIGVNNRDLATLAIDPRQVHHLAPKIPAGRLRVAESGIESREALDRLRGVVDAVLIGTAFMQAEDLEAKLEELRW